MITEGAGLALAGALTLLPALAATGLLEVAHEVYEPRPAARRSYCSWPASGARTLVAPSSNV